jgi:hypothetical protein
MAMTIPHRAVRRRETALHAFVHEWQTFLRWTVLLLLVATIATMTTFYFWAIVPATMAAFAYVVLLVTNELERRSDRRGAEGSAGAMGRAESDERTVAGAAAEDEHVVAMPLVRHETTVVTVGGLALLVIAAIVAAAIFGGWMMLFAIPFLFAYIVLLGLPAWLAAIEDDIEDEQHKLESGGAAGASGD